MLTLQDCLDMCDLQSEVVEAIAAHEHLPGILATELANCLACSTGGQAVIHRCLMDELAVARRRGDHIRAGRLRDALAEFRATHPGVPALS